MLSPTSSAPELPEFIRPLLKSSKFGGTDRGEIRRVTEEDKPFSVQIIGIGFSPWVVFTIILGNFSPIKGILFSISAIPPVCNIFIFDFNTNLY